MKILKKFLMIVGGLTLLDQISEVAISIAGGRFGMFSKGDVHKTTIKAMYAIPEIAHPLLWAAKYRILFWWNIVEK